MCKTCENHRKTYIQNPNKKNHNKSQMKIQHKKSHMKIPKNENIQNDDDHEHDDYSNV